MHLVGLASAPRTVFNPALLQHFELLYNPSKMKHRIASALFSVAVTIFLTFDDGGSETRMNVRTDL